MRCHPAPFAERVRKKQRRGQAAGDNADENGQKKNIEN